MDEEITPGPTEALDLQVIQSAPEKRPTVAYKETDFLCDGGLTTYRRLPIQLQRDIEFLTQLYSRYKNAGIGNTKYGLEIKKILDDDLYQKAEALRRESEQICRELQEPEKISNNEKAALAKLLLDTKYRIHLGPGYQREILIVKDVDQKLVERVTSIKAIDDLLCYAIARTVIKTGVSKYSPPFIKQLSQYWLMYGEEIEKFDTFGGFDTDTWCIGRCSVKPADKEGPMTHWEKFLDRMNDPEAYAAWIYGVASKRYRGRQILWLQGENGEDGKTYNQKFIVKHLFPKVGVAMSNSALGDGSRFMAAEFEGKIIAYWDDCPNTMAIFKEDIKQLSAGDEGNEVRIERKGVDAYTAQLETRMWVNSNQAPAVSHDKYIQSRLLYINLRPLEEAPDIEIKIPLLQEFPAFLWYAKICYESRCKDNRTIKQNDEALKTKDDFADEFDSEYEMIFQKHLILTEDQTEFVLAKDVCDILKGEGLKDTLKQGRFYTWLRKRKGVEKKNRGNRTVVCGIKCSPQ